MKRIVKVLSAAVLAISLTGCEDAVAKLKDADTVIMKVGDKVITKGNVYSAMLAQNGSDVVRNQAMKVIGDIEVEETDEIRESAQMDLEYYRAIYGPSFEESLKQNNLTEEEYVETLIDDQQATKLVTNYIEENFDTMVSNYSPVKATVLTFSKEEDASAVLAGLKDGSLTIDDAKANYDTSSSGKPEIVTMNTTTYGTAMLSVLLGQKADDGWTMVSSTENGNYYVMRVEDDDRNNYKDEIVNELYGTETINNNALAHYFEKYGFHVYDKILYDTIANDYPSILVQK
ncbi:MAG: hypothetical protein IJJ44_03505 [Solobacterium sp.]|nr:hypothetical protein [Solobacterium sp.]